ncbi:MAG: NlpC/P60 family protein [Aeromicrobium sp.]
MPAAICTLRALAATVAALLLSTMVTVSGAQADNPSAGQIQVRLVQMRHDLNALYARSAAAAEQLNGATYRLQQARVDLARRQTAQKQAQASVDDYRDDVGTMTVERLQTHVAGRALVSILDGQQPTDMLQQASARSALDEAMTAELDALGGRQVALDAVTRSVEAAVADQARARAEQLSAQRTIDESIARAEQMKTSAEAERESLLRQLAVAQDRPVAEVTQAQDQLDSRVDEAGPSTAPSSAPPPEPTTSTPAPAPRPAPKPAAQPEPAPQPEPADPPPASGNTVERAIAFARAQLGEKYRWGGAGPSSWDCSGLTMRAWQSAGVGMSHYAGSQYTGFTKVPVSKIKRGDLLFWSDGSARSIYHVAMYLGGGRMIHAPRPGRTVEIVPVTYWIKPDLASRPG